MSFRSIKPGRWAELAGKNLSPDALLLGLFAELGPTAHYSGLYFLPLPDICEQTGLRESAVLAAMDELERAGVVIFDRSRMLVFVPGMMLRQLLLPVLNAKQTKGVLAYVERLPRSSPLLRAFLHEHGLNFPGGGSDTSPDTSIDTPPDTGIDTPPDRKREVRREKGEGRLEKGEGKARKGNHGDSPDDGPAKEKAGAASLDSKSPEADQGNGAGKVRSIKTVALQDIARKVGAREISVDEASLRLRTFGFTTKEINSPSIIGLFKAAIDRGTVQ